MGVQPRESTSRLWTWRPMKLLVPMLPLNSLLSRVLPQLRPPLRSRPLLLVSIHRPLPKLRLRLRLLLNNKPVPVLLLKLLLLLVLMPLLAQTHNILRNKNSTEVSPSMYFNKEPVLSALPDRLPRCNTQVHWPLMVKYSILPSQEDSQLLSRSET